MKRKVFLITSSVLLALLLVILTVSLIVLNNPSEYHTVVPSNVQLVAFTDNDGNIATVTTEDGQEYTLSLFDGNGEKLWSHPLSSYCTVLKTFGDRIAVNEGRNVVVYDITGETLFSVATDYNPVSVAYKDGLFAVASSASKIKNRISVYRITEDNDAVFDGELNFTNDIVQISLYNDSVYFGTGSKIYRLDKETNGYVAREKAVTMNKHNGFYIGKDGTLYCSSDVGNLEIQKALDGEYLITSILKFGNSGSLISENGNGVIATFDYLGNVLVYDTVSGTQVVRFKTETSVKSVSINNAGTLLSFKAGQGVKYYDTFSLKPFAFFQKANLWIIIVVTVFIVTEFVAILLMIDRSRKTIVSVGKKINASKVSYLYLLPAFALLLVFNFYPVFSGFSLAFQDYFPGVRADFVGIDNFVAVFRDSTFWSGTWNMLIFLVADLFKAVICSVFVAETIISVNNQKSQYWARFLMYLPGILPGVASWLIWQEGILGADGIISEIMANIGVEKFANFNFLGDASTAKWALIFIGFPWTGSYLIVYGALKSVPDSIYDAAKLDGFSWIGRIIYIDVPMIRPQLKYLFIVHFISSIQNFSRVYITTNGAFDTQIPALSLYQQITTHQNYGVAAAMGVILFLVIFSFSILNFKEKMKEN